MIRCQIIEREAQPPNFEESAAGFCPEPHESIAPSHNDAYPFNIVPPYGLPPSTFLTFPWIALTIIIVEQF
jgi:hypothetical protein